MYEQAAASADHRADGPATPAARRPDARSRLLRRAANLTARRALQRTAYVYRDGTQSWERLKDSDRYSPFDTDPPTATGKDGSVNDTWRNRRYRSEADWLNKVRQDEEAMEKEAGRAAKIITRQAHQFQAPATTKPLESGTAPGKDFGAALTALGGMKDDWIQLVLEFAGLAAHNLTGTTTVLVDAPTIDQVKGAPQGAEGWTLGTGRVYLAGGVRDLTRTTLHEYTHLLLEYVHGENQDRRFTHAFFDDLQVLAGAPATTSSWVTTSEVDVLATAVKSWKPQNPAPTLAIVVDRAHEWAQAAIDGKGWGANTARGETMPHFSEMVYDLVTAGLSVGGLQVPLPKTYSMWGHIKADLRRKRFEKYAALGVV
jgi:hypothetical protein